jgi:8-oxo-dGTP pyrophosphatase MutT (NUDIX family)
LTANSIPVRDCVSALLVDEQGRLVIQLRDNKPGLLFPAHWATLGGGIEKGETPDEAMRRELEEEISPAPPVAFWRYFEHTYRVRGEKRMVANHVYVGQLPCALEDMKLFEGERLGAFAAHDLDNLRIAYGLEIIFKAFFETYEHRTGDNL